MRSGIVVLFLFFREELSKDARVIYRHNLTGGLETAIRSSNAQFENADILERLDVRLLDVLLTSLIYR